MNSQTQKQVLVIDDHPLFRDAFSTVLAGLGAADVTILGAGSLEEAQTLLAESDIHIAFLDLNLPDAKGFEGLLRLKAAKPDLPIYIVSATEDAAVYEQAREIGAAGYTPKSLPKDELDAVLATALEGGSWFPPAQDDDADQPVDADTIAARVASLTPTQRRVVGYLSEGLLNKQIAYEMDVSIATVKAHMTAIFRKLGVINRTQVVLALQDLGKQADG